MSTTQAQSSVSDGRASLLNLTILGFELFRHFVRIFGRNAAWNEILVCRENFVLFGHLGHELQRFKNLVFSINLYPICHCSKLFLYLANSIQMYSNLCPGYPNNTKFSKQTNFSMKISILGSISGANKDQRSVKF